MEAHTHRHGRLPRLGHLAFVAAALCLSTGAQYRSANFVVETADPAFAQQVAQTAEKWRSDLASEWLGQAMPNWAQPCVMHVQAGPRLSPGGSTSFVFDHGEVFGWVMSIQGSQERILDCVLPHEITHMIFASHFREPLPRWADEGGATSVEHVSEKNKHRKMLYDFLRTNRGIAFNQMFAMTEYPQDIMPLYAQGYALSEFLIQTGGRRKYVEFLGEGLKTNDWPTAVARHYGIKGLGALQNTWLAWVRQGMPAITSPSAQPAAPDTMLAANTQRPKPEPNLIYHIRNEQASAPVPGKLVPVHIAAATRNTASLAWSKPNTAPTATPSPRPSADQITSADLRQAATLPASGWHRVGQPLPAGATADIPPTPAVDPARTQLAHPLAIEQTRQTVIR